ncbi:unnamed protein product [Sphagnum troendelagicum]|jgi:serine/threonine protein kinase
MERVMKASEKRYESGLCGVIGVSVDEKGRVSTVMELMDGDLRNFIDFCHPLLSYDDKLGLMKAIARGIKELHGCGFIHKDLKASNILVSPVPSVKLHWRVKDKLRISLENTKSCYWRLIDVKIGDYESSDVVLGTGFFRAPEVLRALRDGRKVEYSAAVDVYGFGMICYELLTGKLPFQGHRLSDYGLVLSGERPDVSNEVPWMRKLLHRCWHEDPHQRPGWDEILKILM